MLNEKCIEKSGVITFKEAIIAELEGVGFTNYYLQIFDPNCKLERRIDLLLKVIGMNPAILGYAYTKEAIKIVFEKSSKTVPFCDVYIDIWKKLDVKKISSVERAIRHSKEMVLKSLKPEMKALIFGNPNLEKMENNTFVHSLAVFLNSFEI